MELITNTLAALGFGETDAQKQQEINQRRSLAQLAAQQGELDQAVATGARAKGGQLLKFATDSLSGTGSASLG